MNGGLSKSIFFFFTGTLDFSRNPPPLWISFIKQFYLFFINSLRGTARSSVELLFTRVFMQQQQNNNINDDHKIPYIIKIERYRPFQPCMTE